MKNFISFTISILFIFNTAVAQEWVWGLKATGNHQGKYKNIAVDNDGNSVIAGYYQKSMILDGHSLYTDDDYYADMFLGRLNPEGRVLWLKSIEAGQTYGDNVGVTLDDENNIYLTGSDNGYIFVSKYNSVGKLLWKNNFEYKYYGYGKSIAIDQYDNVYVIGDSGWSFFAAKLDYYGKIIWVRDIEVNYSNAFNVSDIDVDARGNAYFVGAFGVDSIQLDDIVIERKGGSTFWGKMSPEGKFLWVKASSGRTNEQPQIALTADENIYISGAFYGSMKIEDTTLDGLCCSNPKPYLAKYDSSGNYIWAKVANTTYESKGTTTDIKVDLDGNLYLTGRYFTCYGTFCTEGDYYIEKYSNSGNVLWRKEFNHSDGDQSFAIDIDNKGFIYVIANTLAEDFIDDKSVASVNSVGIGKLNTFASTSKRTQRPVIERIQYNCSNSGLISLSAEGQDVKWYDEPDLKNHVYSGEIYEKEFQSTDTLYVTQTMNNIESWPKEVIIYKPDFNSEVIKYQKDTLFVSLNDFLSYKWNYNGNPIEDSNSHYYIPLEDGIYSVELIAGDCSVALDYNFKRPDKPETDSIRLVCSGESLGALNATGENIIWYRTTSYNDTLHVGNEYIPNITSDGVFYVRQTINDVASAPQRVEVQFSTLNDEDILYRSTSLSVTNDKRFSYQWYLDDMPIEDAKSNVYSPQKNGLYTVVIKDSICSKTLSKYFVQQPKIDSNIYYVCQDENMPLLKAEGENLVWRIYDYEKMEYDTIFVGSSFTPEFSHSEIVYLSQSENGFSSYPLAIHIAKADFSSFEVNKSSYSLSISNKNSYYYTYKWYLNESTTPVTDLSYVYYPHFGEYKVNISLDNKCDTTLYFSYYPEFDSIYYVCSDINPVLTIDSYDVQWYSDRALTNLIGYGRNLYPVLNGKDSTFYVAQIKNSEVVWSHDIQVIYPKLNEIKLGFVNGKIVIDNHKPYYTYIWEYDDSIMDFNDYYCVPDKDGTYNVIITAGDCSTSLSYDFMKSHIVSLPSEDKEIKIYPNPTYGEISITTNIIDNSSVHLKMYSEKGVLLLSESYHTPLINIDISSFEEGVYILQFKTNSGVKNYKVLKLK